MNQSHKRSFIAVLIFIGFLLFMAFWGIDLILGAYAGHKLSKLAERHHLDIRYDNIRLIGLSTVRMEGLTVIPIDADTLIHADRLQAKLELPGIICNTSVSVRLPLHRPVLLLWQNLHRLLCFSLIVSGSIPAYDMRLRLSGLKR